jgi:hypothetical protein
MLASGCNSTVSTTCNNDTECDDGVYCNGAETCDPASHKCKAGTVPSCDDSVACTHDVCNEETRMCDHLPDNGGCNAGEFCDDKGGCIANCKDSDCNTACATAGLTGGKCVVAAFCQCAPSPAPGTVSGSAFLFGHTASDSAHDHSGITVALAGTTFMATTNPDGSWSIPGVPPGVYAVTYSKTKFLPKNTPSLTVAPAMTTIAPDTTLRHGKQLGDAAPPTGNLPGYCWPVIRSASFSPDQSQIAMTAGDVCFEEGGGLFAVPTDGSRAPVLLDGAAEIYNVSPGNLQMTNTHLVYQPLTSTLNLQHDNGVWSRPLSGATAPFRLMPVPTPAGSTVDIIPGANGTITGSAKYTVIHRTDNTTPNTPNSWTAFKVDGSGTPVTVWQQTVATTETVAFMLLDDTNIIFARQDSTGAATQIHAFNLTTSTDSFATLPTGSTSVFGPFQFSPDHAWVVGNYNTTVPVAAQRTFLFQVGTTNIQTSSQIANATTPISDSTGFAFVDNVNGMFFWGTTVVPSPNPIQLVPKASFSASPQVLGKMVGYLDVSAVPNVPKATSIPTAGFLVPFTTQGLDNAALNFTPYVQVVKDGSGNEIGANVVWATGGTALQFKGVSITFPLTSSPTVGVLGQALDVSCSTDLNNNPNGNGVLNGGFFYWCNDSQTLSRFAPPFSAVQAKTDVDTPVVAAPQALNGAQRVAYRKADGSWNSADATSKALLSQVAEASVTFITSNPWVFFVDRATGLSRVSQVSGSVIDEPLTDCAIVYTSIFGVNPIVQPQKIGNNVFSMGSICPSHFLNPYIVATANLP